MSKVKLHRCKFTWLHIDADACWKVQKELDAKGIEYEIVKHPKSMNKRDEVERVSGQKLFPVIEFGDGTAYRDESDEMAKTVRDGRLFEKDAGAAAPSPA